jgi:hypothetical protein
MTVTDFQLQRCKQFWHVSPKLSRRHHPGTNSIPLIGGLLTVHRLREKSRTSKAIGKFSHKSCNFYLGTSFPTPIKQIWEWDGSDSFHSGRWRWLPAVGDLVGNVTWGCQGNCSCRWLRATDSGPCAGLRSLLPWCLGFFKKKWRYSVPRIRAPADFAWISFCCRTW